MGISVNSVDSGRSSEQFTTEEVQKFQTLSRRRDLYSDIVKVVLVTGTALTFLEPCP